MIDAITVSHVSKHFGDCVAVDDVSLNIPRGQIVALLGHNGAGKSTLIDMILGLQPTTSGSARILGFNPREAISRSLVGVVHQSGALLPEYTVGQLLSLFAALYPRPRPLDDVCAEADIQRFMRTRIGRLSGGEQQRVRLALALLPDPEILILDEPTAGMDVLARRSFWDLMQLQASQGRTIVFATHYLAEVEDFAERTIMMKRGRVVLDGATGDIQRRSAFSTLSISLPFVAGQSSEDTLAARMSIEAGIREVMPSGRGVLRWEGDRVVVEAADTDPVAEFVLGFPGAQGLSVVPSTLEDVYARVMGDEGESVLTSVFGSVN